MTLRYAVSQLDDSVLFVMSEMFETITFRFIAIMSLNQKPEEKSAHQNYEVCLIQISAQHFFFQLNRDLDPDLDREQSLPKSPLGHCQTKYRNFL